MRFLSAVLPERRTSLENPSVPLSSPQAYALLAGQITTDAGVNVSEFTAMRTMAVWRCVQLIAGTIAQLPIRVWAGRPGDPDRKAIECEVLEKPNPDLTKYELIETSLVHDLLWGNAYWLKIPNEGGDSIAQIWNLAPWSVIPNRGHSTRPGIPGTKEYRLNNVGSGVKLTDEEIVHFPGLGYDSVRGLSPIAYAREGIAVGVAAEKFGARFFGSGTQMGGILSTDKQLTEDQAETIKVRWRNKMTGIDKAHEVAVLDSAMKWTAITIPPEDAQFLQTRQYSVEEVCRLFGVPPHLAMMVDKTTSWGAGIAEQSTGFHRYTLSQWLTRFEQRITKGVLPVGQFAEIDADKILRGDTAARYASYAMALAGGWLSRQEIRLKEDLPKGPAELEEYLQIALPALAFGGKEPKGS